MSKIRCVITQPFGLKRATSAVVYNVNSMSCKKQWHAVNVTSIGSAVFVGFTVVTRYSLVVSVLDSGAEGPGYKSQPRRCRVTVLGKLFIPVVPLVTKQRNW